VPVDWQAADAALLWRYHLHYFEWAWSFMGAGDDSGFRQLWRSWRAASPLGSWPAWSPYVASLRAWALCGVHGSLVRGTEEEAAYVADLANHARFLRANLEFDVGGNHLIKNVKALIGLGVFLGDGRIESIGRRHLAGQLAVQVLADGGHFERSPSYHCQVLGDLLDVRGLLAAAGRPPVDGLDAAITKMRDWLGTMLMPDGDVPLLNDCVRVGPDQIALLEPARRFAASADRLAVLQPSGYVVVRPDARTWLVADVGPPCPPTLPAHAHADALSFELCVAGARVVVDTGTSTYEAGPRRQYERSTAAHNTVEVDGHDSTEVWGAFRAGRRAAVTLERAVDDGGAVEVVASHDGYRHLPGAPVHRRTWLCRPGTIEIIDGVLGGGAHDVVARLHIAPEGARLVEVDNPSAPVVEAAEVATGFGALQPAQVLVSRVTGPLPVTLRTVLRVQCAGDETADDTSGRA
jgi:uncharacterized heparinase superfamily protein